MSDSSRSSLNWTARTGSPGRAVARTVLVVPKSTPIESVSRTSLPRRPDFPVNAPPTVLARGPRPCRVSRHGVPGRSRPTMRIFTPSARCSDTVNWRSSRYRQRTASRRSAEATTGASVRSGLVWGFFCQAVVLGCAESFLFGAGKAVFRPVACTQVPGARGRGQGTETLAELGGLPP